MDVSSRTQFLSCTDMRSIRGINFILEREGWTLEVHGVPHEDRAVFLNHLVENGIYKLPEPFLGIGL